MPAGNVWMGKEATPHQFLASDTTLTAGQDKAVTSTIANVVAAKKALIVMKGKAAAASTSTVTFRFVGRAHKWALWSTVKEFETTMTLNGTTLAVEREEKDLEYYTEIKLLSILNGDSGNALADVNAYVEYKY